MFHKKIIVDLLGCTVLPIEKKILQHPKVAGVILFTRNYENKKQLKKLITDIRKCVNREFLITVDHEGGNIWRFCNEDFTRIKSAKYFGELYEKDKNVALKEVYDAGFIMAKELLDCGVDLSFAPVIDLDYGNKAISGKDRSFHKDPIIVASLAGKFIDGMHAAGMKSCTKHFPGHGNCISDPHFTNSVDERELSEIEKNDLIPFVLLLPKTDMILVSHVLYPKVDSKKAVYSSFWIKKFLREKLNFEGIVISDCLKMEAANIGDYGFRVKKAFEAGCDLAILSQEVERDELLAVLDKINV